MSTYSLSIAAVSADTRFPLSTGFQNMTLPDDGARAGSQANNAQTGAEFLVKMPDGSLRRAKMDHERSLPGAPVVRFVV